ncbi:S9 family peptidase [Aegicerativicinus sediminis]|uniref:S9 family peptidase n=1 Tax=Aegicerativicinus sediminis TaxID=2893202 RepID=UPI001E5F0101|nr:S9 family peptidase [Aegicerativicinus sediminis]
MRTFITILSCTVLFNVSLSQNTNTTTPPKAKKIPETLTIHGDSRIDNYFWMRLSDEQKNASNPDSQTEDVLAYLKEENAYLNLELNHLPDLRETLYNEITGRIKEDDASVPVTENGYSYYTRYEKGKNYPLYCRKKAGINSKEEILLNGPEMAKGKKYFSISNLSVSPNNNLLIFGVDTVSRRRYDLYVKNLETGDIYKDVIGNTTGSGVWANDNKTFFYTSKDLQTLRSNKVFKHKLGTLQSEDKLVFEETDEEFSTWVSKSKSKDYIFIGSFQTLSTEMRYLDADTPDGEFEIIQPRERNLIYRGDHYGDSFYLVTNNKATNFKLVKAPVKAPGLSNWSDVIPHREDVFIENVELFKDFLVVQEREAGLRQIRVMKWSGGDYYLPFKDPTYSAYISANPEFDTDLLRYGYSSFTTPNSIYDYNMKTKEQTLLKQDEVMDPNFSSDNYKVERVFAEVRDGTKVPVSIVYKNSTNPSSTTPLLLYGYGSYGSSQNASFNSTILSLLDRGFIYAIAHIRGGQEMGRKWYEDGKLLKKKNTFTDFIDVGRYLVDKNYTSSDHLYAYGGSAGGLLMGAVINMAPGLWNGIIAAVPFVDVVSTMLDETIPLTTFEFDEWGNPKDENYYRYMLSYSPYDNVEAKDYPNMLITTGYWDSQVQYWEPAKWTAKLRELKTDDNQLYLYTDMESGHGGASGRFERFKRFALMYAFILDLEGIKE